ncbi:hypothetical protein [Mycobacterium sp. AZCC_0083]|uniref:hypothetical protein n=1 Tax=Mycobacterium sp. AZCC_0083 TaxID=2735882 RepID=UPI0035C95A92
MQKWIECTTTSILAARDKGAAPDAIPAQDLAISPNLMNERTMFAATPADSSHRYANICSCPVGGSEAGPVPRSCTRTSTPSTHRSSSAMTRRCAIDR